MTLKVQGFPLTLFWTNVPNENSTTVVCMAKLGQCLRKPLILSHKRGKTKPKGYNYNKRGSWFGQAQT